MLDLKTQLIETAVRPLEGDAESRLAAAQLLGELVKPGSAGAEEAIARWEEVDRKKRLPVWRILLWVVLIAVSLAVGIKEVPEVVRYVRWARWIGSFGTFSMESSPIIEPAREYTPRQRLLLFGESPTSTPLEKSEALWRSEPENPAFFAEYAAAYAQEHNKMPTGFLEIAKRLDPQNAWFTYQAAAAEATDAVKGKSRRSKTAAGFWSSGPKTWEILNQGRVDRTLELIREAATQEKWEDYASGMLKERISLLPQRNLAEKINLFSVLSRTTLPSIRLRPIADVITAKAWSCGEAGDVPGVQEIVREGEHFLRGISTPEAGTLVDQLIANVCAASLAESFADAAGKVGLAEVSVHWKAISERLQERGKSRNSREFIVDGKVVKAGTVSGTLIGGTIEMVAKQAEHQPPLTDADLKPGRLQDHEILSRFCCYVLWILVGLCLGLTATYRYRVPAMSRRLAGRMELLLDSVDWLWVLGAGVLLPFAFVMVVNRLTPLGGREFSLLGNSMLLPTAHFLGLLILWLIVPPQIVRWRLAKRAGVLGFPGTSWLDWLAVAIAAGFVPVIGWAAVSDSLTAFSGIWRGGWKWGSTFPPNSVLLFGIAVALLGVSVLWLFSRILFALLSGSQRLVHRAAASRVLVYVHAFAMLVLALASLGFKVTEQYWFERDTLNKADANVPGWTRYEYQVAMQMGKELRETLGYTP